MKVLSVEQILHVLFKSTSFSFSDYQDDNAARLIFNCRFLINVLKTC